MKKLLLTVFSFIALISYGQYTYLTNFNMDAGFPGVSGMTSTTAPSTANGWTEIIPPSISANQWSSAVAIPFPFNFYGTPATSCVASANGLLTFTSGVSGTPPNANAALPAAVLPNNTIAALWDDFTAGSPTGTNDRVLSNVFGTAPNRELWVYWFSYEHGNPTLSFHYKGIMLQETTDKVFIIDAYSSATPALTATSGLQKDAIVANEIGSNLAQQPGNTSTLALADYWEFTPLLLSNDNAGIDGINTPGSPLVPGAQPVDVVLKNWGQNALTSATINWSIDGILQTPFNFTGSLASLGTTNVAIGSGTFPSGNSVLEVWTSLPNGVADTDPSNDTLTTALCTALSGVYTIGGAAGPTNYATFGEVETALNSCGISGPVTFNITPGTYTGSLDIATVVGSSATNTITFDGGAAATTTLTSAGTANNATISLTGTEYITFQNMTIENTKTGVDAWGVFLTSGANEVTVDNCTIMLSTSTSSDRAGVVSSNLATSATSYGNNAENITVSNCTILNAYYGIRLNGNTSGTNNTLFLDGHVITGNTIDAVFSGVYFARIDSSIISNNTITTTGSNTGMDGIYVFDVSNFVITGNNINVPDYGVYISDGNLTADGSVIGRSLLANNMIISSADYGIYFDDVEFTDVYFNTSFAQPAMRVNDAVDLNVVNNIFVSSTDYAFEDIDASPAVGYTNFDNNIFNTGGTNMFDFGSTYADLASFQAAFTALNVNSIEGDPLFVSATDLHLLGTIADGVAIPIPFITTDIDGDARTATPDIGADEYTPATCFPPTALTDDFLGSDSVVVSWTAGGTETLWDIEYGPTGFVSGSGTILTGVMNPASITGLMPQTNYDYYVRSSCGGVTSLWAGPHSFLTACLNTLNGVYTIGGAVGPTNFATFLDAQNELNVCGISGPVVFNITPGSYSETLELNDVVGTSAVNTITFDGGSSATTTLTSAGGTDNATISLNGTKHTSFINMTIENSKVGVDAWGVFLTNGTDGITIDNCIITLDASTSSDRSCIQAGGSSTSAFTDGNSADNLTVTNNTLLNAYYGVYLNGEALAAGFDNGNVISNNTMDVHYYGVYLDNQIDVTISDNIISNSSGNSFMDGIYCLDLVDFVITGNTVNVPDYGIYVSDGNFDAPPTGRSLIANNMVQSDTDYGIYILDNIDVDVFHNTSLADRPMAVSGTPTSNLDVRNNIFVSNNNDYAFSDFNTTPSGYLTFDFNIFETGGTNMFDFGPLYADLAAFQAANPALNVNSLEGDPLFVSSTDLHVLGLLADGVATPIASITVDIDGDARTATPDIGADEYSPATCFPPTMLSTVFVGSDSAVLTWTPNNAVDSLWDVEYDLTGFTQGTGVVSMGLMNPASISGLIPNTTYDYYVRTSCDVAEQSVWTGPFTFTTACLPFAVPYTEDFNAGTSIPSCWNMSGSENWIFATTGGHVGNAGTFGTSTSGGNFAYVDDSTPDNVGTTLTSPLVDVNGAASNSLIFNLISNNEGNSNATLNVDVYDGAAWNNGFFTNTGNTVAGDWELIKLDLSSLTITGPIQFRFVVDELVAGDFYDDIAIDDVTVCQTVVNMTAIPVSICNGDTFTLNSGVDITTTGMFNDTLTAASGCDSVFTYDVTVITNPVTMVPTTLCQGDTFTLPNGIEATMAGMYDDTLSAVNTCDSIVRYDVTMIMGATSSQNVALCQGQTFTLPGGTVISSGGSYNEVYDNASANGCDSTVTYIVTVNVATSSTQDVHLCDGATFTLPLSGLVVSAANSYVETTMNSVGCDSTIIYNVTIGMSSAQTLAVSYCAGDSVMLADGSYASMAGTMMVTTTNASGCDHVITYNVTENAVTMGTTTASICTGASYMFDGQMLTMAGVYTMMTTGSNGCDSTVELTLTVLPSAMGTTTASICMGDSYMFDGNMLTMAGVYTMTMSGQAANGCDSIVELTLSVNQPTSSAMSASICNGDTYMFDGNMLTTAGMYTMVTPGANGCDSTVTLILAVNATSSNSISATICNGDTYIFDGNTLTTAGTYTATGTNAAGCDSITTLTLAVDMAMDQTMSASICRGETYEFGSQMLTTAGTYTETFTNDNGCSYDVTLTLTVNNSVSTSEEVLLCGDVLDYTLANGTVVTAGGVYTATVVAANGCDSIITYNVSTCVGIFNVENNIGMVAYPNPTSNVLNIEFSENLSNENSVVILNVLGQAVYSVENISDNTVIVNTSEFTSGVYYINVTSDNKTSVKSFTVSK